MQSCTHTGGEPLRDPWRPGLFWAYMTRSMVVACRACNACRSSVGLPGSTRTFDGPDSTDAMS